jgi:O-antigen/teichoic acid export membrane protein
MKKYLLLSNNFLNRAFNKGHDRSVNAKKNIFASFIIKGFSIAITLLLVPLTIHYVNPTQYGIWLTLSGIVGWFSFFDIGFGNGLRNKFAFALANDQKEQARIYVSTTYAILSIIIGIVLVFFCIANQFIDWTKILNTSPRMGSELSLLALIVFVFFCLQFVLQLLTTVITADQKPAKASLYNMLGSALSLLIIFILIKTTHGSLIYLAFALGISPVLVLLLSSLWFYTHDYKYYAPSFKYVNFSHAKGLMNLGLKFFLVQIAALIIYETDNIVITQLFGPASVTPYNIAYKYFGVIAMVFNIIMNPLWSAYTEAYARRDIDWIKRIINKIMHLWALIACVGVIMLILANIVYRLWIGPSINVEFLLSVSIMLTFITNAWCGIFSQFLNGVGKLRLQMYSGLLGAIVNIPLSIFLGHRIGISGVVLATCIIGLISAIWSPIQYHKIINNKAKGIWNK